jgi:hypothetical protein
LLSGWFAVALPVLLAADAGGPAPQDRPSPPLLAPQPPPQATPEAGGRVDLREARDGSGDLVYEATRFTARVAPDGTVTFKDKTVSDPSLLPFLPMRTDFAVPSLQSSLKSLLKGRSPPATGPSELDQGLPPPETKQVIPDVSRYRPDTREASRYSQNYWGIPVIGGVGGFDLSDELTRFSGKDPNRYQKAAFLATTHERRIAMAVRMHAVYIRRAVAELPARLQALACDERLSHGERRAILAALGAEMDTSIPEGAKAAADINAFLARFDSGDVTCANPPRARAR